MDNSHAKTSMNNIHIEQETHMQHKDVLGKRGLERLDPKDARNRRIRIEFAKIAKRLKNQLNNAKRQAVEKAKIKPVLKNTLLVEQG